MTGTSGVELLAHGGGAPEAAMVGLPVLVLVVFAVLERRARRREAEQGAPELPDESTGRDPRSDDA